MICLSMKSSKVFVIKIFLNFDFVIILIDIEINWLLTFYLTWYRVNSIFIFISISVKCNLLRDRNSYSKILCCCSFKFKKILMITNISVIIFIPFLIKQVSLLVCCFAWNRKVFFDFFLLLCIFFLKFFFSFFFLSHYLVIISTCLSCQLGLEFFQILWRHLW